MDFLDRISASVSKAAKQVSDTTRAAADKNRIRKELAAMENELRNRFRDIGEKYFNDTRDNPAPEYRELFDELMRLQANLAAKQHELEAIEGMVTCPECGRSIARESRFCPNCGAPAPVIAPPAEPERSAEGLCPVCGAQLADDAVFCAACGNKITRNEPAPAASTPAHCPNCGTELAPNALFCPTCGNKAPGLN